MVRGFNEHFAPRKDSWRCRIVIKAKERQLYWTALEEGGGLCLPFVRLSNTFHYHSESLGTEWAGIEFMPSQSEFTHAVIWTTMPYWWPNRNCLIYSFSHFQKYRVLTRNKITIQNASQTCRSSLSILLPMTTNGKCSGSRGLDCMRNSSLQPSRALKESDLVMS